jgi:hypothetical protein
MNRISLLLITAAALLFGCGDRAAQTGSDDPDSVSTDPHLASADLPGILIAPTGDTVHAVPGTAIILYYWIPLNKYGEMEADLLFLASLDSTYQALPLQPDHDARNHAQRIVNDIGISLPVYLADSTTMESIETGILPSCLVLTPEGGEYRETGFGAPSRILASIQNGER